MKNIEMTELANITGGDGWDFLCGAAIVGTVGAALATGGWGGAVMFAYVSGPVCAYAIAT